MTRVEILYNTYAGSSRITINGQPVSGVSALSRFQTQPFAGWYAQLLDAVEREVNDSFSLRLLARPAEGQLLQPLALRCGACVSYQRSGTPLDDPALLRLKHLSQMITTGALPACPRQRFAVRIYCPDPAALQADPALKKLLPRLAFCKGELQVLPLTAFTPSQADATVYMTSGEVDDRILSGLHRCSEGSACLIRLGAGSPPAVEEGIYTCGAAAGEATARIGEFLEWQPFVALLLRTLACYDPETLGIHRAAVAALGAVSPQIQVEPVTLLELGQTLPMKISVYPPGNPVPPVQIQTSTATVVAVKDGALVGAGLGKCMITVVQPGEQRPVAHFQATVIQRNRITELKLSASTIRTEVDRPEKLTYTFEPENADNVSQVRFQSSNGLIASVDQKGVITPRSAGSCTISVHAEGVSAACEVQVFAKLTAFVVEPAEMDLMVGEAQRVQLTFVPANTLMEPVTAHLSDPAVIAYDLRSGYVEGKQPGSCTVRLVSQNGQVGTSFQVTVRAKHTGPKGLLQRLFGG